MRVLVLGGTGAIGVALVKLLEMAGHDVFVTSRSAHENSEKVQYLQGNAADDAFLHEILAGAKYDAIVDFMLYDEAGFAKRCNDLLRASEQYLFISSARVYAESVRPITEQSPRLLDVCTDDVYLSTREYALEKARQENILMSSTSEKWTIIRPYITYSEQRFQLGVFEKEHWLYRVLKGRTALFPQMLACHKTTLTCGQDVALAIFKFIGNKEACGQAVNIATTQCIGWEDVLKLYSVIINEFTGIMPDFQCVTDTSTFGQILKNQYQIKYDRALDRCFDSSKTETLCGGTFEYMAVETGLRGCLQAFLNSGRKFREINWAWEAYQDRVTRGITPLEEIPNNKQKLKYLAVRFLPWSLASKML